MKNYEKFEFDGNEYHLRPLPIAEKKRIKRKNMFEKDHVTFELILFRQGSVVFVSGLLITLIKLFGWCTNIK